MGRSNVAVVQWTDQRSPRLLAYLFSEVSAIYGVLRLLRRLDFSVCLVYQAYLPLTILVLRILRKRVLLCVGGSSYAAAFYDGPMYVPRFKVHVRRFFEVVCWMTCDNLIVPSRSMIESMRLQPYGHKVLVLPNYPANLSSDFRKTKRYVDREMVIGYVGDLRNCKGVGNFVDAIPLVIQRLDNARFWVIGDGPMRTAIADKIETCGVRERVRMFGRVPHSQLPAYYNELRLLVVPSFTEGLPSVVLEGMACSTPVLATRVGGIPDIIRDGETGFLLDNNNPTRIAQRIVELMGSDVSWLEKIGEESARIVLQSLGSEGVETAWRRAMLEIARSTRLGSGQE
jgi:glycosyltransferase involved in cell wall biosynthesis